MPNSKRLLILILFGTLLGGMVISEGSNITQPVTVASPLVLNMGTISCPTCFTGPNTSGVGVVIGTYSGLTTGNGFQPPVFGRVNAGAYRDLVWPTSGWFVNPCVYARAAQAQGRTFRTFLMKNSGVVGTVEQQDFLSLPAGYPVGVTCDSNSFRAFRVTRGDTVNRTQGFLGGAAGANIDGITFQFIGDTQAEIPVLTDSLVDQTIPAASTRFLSPYSGVAVTGSPIITTENASRVVVPFAATIRYLACSTSGAQPGTGTLVFSVRNNGAASGISATVPAGNAFGIYTDFTNTSAISAGQTISWQAQNNAPAAVSATLNNCSMTLVASSGTPSLVGMRINSAFGAGTTNFASPLVTEFSTTEGNERSPVNKAGVARNLYAFVETAGGGGSSTAITLMQNGVATALTGTVPAATTGVIALDLVNTVSFAATDNWDVRIAQTGAGGAVITSISFQYN